MKIVKVLFVDNPRMNMLGPIMIVGILIGLLELLICVFIAVSVRSKSIKSNIIEKPKANACNKDEISTQ